MNPSTSDFPEFDQAYRNVLVKDGDDLFETLASRANFNVYHSDIWQGTARRFAESIVLECIAICEAGTATQTTCSGVANLIQQRFGIKK